MSKERELFTMSNDELEAHIQGQPKDLFQEVFEVDYGNPMRGQGKRSGGMVRGAMFDVSLRGKKKDVDPFAKLNLTDEERIEIGGPMDTNYLKYTKARAAGFGHGTAMVYSYRDGGSIQKARDYSDRKNIGVLYK